VSRLTRAILVVVALAVAVTVGAAAVRAADPLLGATVESHLYADTDRQLDVWSRSTVPVVVTFAPSGGWALEPTSLTLNPDEHGSVAIAQLGIDGSPVAVTVAAVDPAPEGTQRGEIALDAWLYTVRPFDWLPWIVAAGLCFATAGAFAVRRFARR
jgi:hypothetical protein